MTYSVPMEGHGIILLVIVQQSVAQLRLTVRAVLFVAMPFPMSRIAKESCSSTMLETGWFYMLIT